MDLTPKNKLVPTKISLESSHWWFYKTTWQTTSEHMSKHSDVVGNNWPGVGNSSVVQMSSLTECPTTTRSRCAQDGTYLLWWEPWAQEARNSAVVPQLRPGCLPTTPGKCPMWSTIFAELFWNYFGTFGGRIVQKQFTNSSKKVPTEIRPVFEWSLFGFVWTILELF